MQKSEIHGKNVAALIYITMLFPFQDIFRVYNISSSQI